MNHKFADWASIAEVISGIAVVITLVFLVVGIRENTEINRAAAYDRSIDGMNQWRFEVSQNPELARMYGAHEGLFGADAGPEEVDYFRLSLIVNAVWGVYEKSYYANRYGVWGHRNGRDSRSNCANGEMRQSPLAAGR
jgi:hypothetical protein